jgi:ketosteroid isomerase-like protein
MPHGKLIVALTLVTACGANNPHKAPDTVAWDEGAAQQARAEVTSMMNAFAAMDAKTFEAGLADEVAAYELDVDGKPVRLATRADVVRYVEGTLGELSKAGARLAFDVHTRDCRATSVLAYCTVEFDAKVTMPDGRTILQPSRNSMVLSKTSAGWKWTHWHSSLSSLPATHSG